MRHDDSATREKTKGDGYMMNGFTVWQLSCTLYLLWARQVFDRWLQAKHFIFGCYACTDDEVPGINTILLPSLKIVTTKAQTLKTSRLPVSLKESDDHIHSLR